MPFGSRAAHQRMLKLAIAYWQSQLVFVAARLGIAEHLETGPLTATEIALRVGAHPPHAHRVLRALASLGVLRADRQQRYSLTSMGQCLRADHPESVRDFLLMQIDGPSWQAWGALAEAVEHGGSAFERVHGRALFPYLQAHPERERAFSAAMASLSLLETEAVGRAYAFGRRRQVVDVGGAHGHLLATLLRRHPRLRGILFDQPQIIDTAQRMRFLDAQEIAGRCELLGGDFFQGVPAGADAYLLKHILHDWDDESCVRILVNCRQAMAAGGRVLVIEQVIRPGNRADWTKLVDINMLVMAEGRERTRAEFAELFARARLRLARQIATASPLKIFEGVAA